MMKLVLLGFAGGLAFIGLMGACLFAGAGRWDLPSFWAYLGMWTAAIVLGMFVADPTLVKERIRPGPGGKDYLTVSLLTIPWFGQFIVAGLDVGRYHWSDTIPFVLQVTGLVAVAAAFGVLIWATAVNRFFSSVIRIQTDRGHHVITRGPYRFVRHPAYAVCPLLMIGSGLALGSWLATLIGLLMVPAILHRTVLEDRILREELPGYAEYAKRVRYQLFPGVW
jgi:protein-S-isoprenylcysteine O-methyltransferase Ste14